LHLFISLRQYSTDQNIVGFTKLVVRFPASVPWNAHYRLGLFSKMYGVRKRFRRHFYFIAFSFTYTYFSQATWAHRAALISISIALSQTRAYNCETTETGLVNRVVCLFTPRLLHR